MKVYLTIFACCVAAVAARKCDFPCTKDYGPLCGHDGKTYSTICALRKEACLRQEAITKVNLGKCNGCVTYCMRIFSPVCGSDGKKYQNECSLQVTSCKKASAISITATDAKRKDCSKCNFPCTKERKPVCGSDGKTYDNACELGLAACNNRKAIIVVHESPCRC